MINSFLLYIILKLDSIGVALAISIALCILAFVIFFCFYIVARDYNEKEDLAFHVKWIKKIAIALCILTPLCILLPSTEDAIIILINDNVTADNINLVVNTLKDSVDYIVNAISTIK